MTFFFAPLSFHLFDSAVFDLSQTNRAELIRDFSPQSALSYLPFDDIYLFTGIVFWTKSAKPLLLSRFSNLFPIISHPYPDIEYILPIARFFNITADFLLDNDIIQKNDECEKNDENPGVEIKLIVPTGNDLNDDFETIREIADYLLDKKTTVILNLENVSQEMETRYLDFLKGIAYSIEGQIRKAADNKYFLAPKHIDIQQDRRQQIKIP